MGGELQGIVPVRFIVEVFDAVVLPNVMFNALAVIAPVPLITYTEPVLS